MPTVRRAAATDAEAVGRLKAASWRSTYDVVEGNDGARRFYERLGAARTGRHAATWAPGVTEARYVWPDLRALARC